jgi:co-chaperonin GroES (HSP10)
MSKATHATPITDAIREVLTEKDPFAAVRPYVNEDLNIPLEALPYPERFNLIVRQVSIKKKIGSIILADQTVSAQEWTHGTAVVCKVGPSVFRGQRFKDMGLGPEDGPKVGDLVYVMPRNPNRFEVDGELYMLIADDGIFARLDPKHAHRITYKF